MLCDDEELSWPRYYCRASDIPGRTGTERIKVAGIPLDCSLADLKSIILACAGHFDSEWLETSDFGLKRATEGSLWLAGWIKVGWYPTVEGLYPRRHGKSQQAWYVLLQPVVALEGVTVLECSIWHLCDAGFMIILRTMVRRGDHPSPPVSEVLLMSIRNVYSPPRSMTILLIWWQALARKYFLTETLVRSYST